MQIMESSSLGLRAARHRFVSRDSPVSVTLFPMVHVGEARFFQNVYERAFAHDCVLVEGVDSPIVRRLTRAYRWIEGSRLGLVIQPRYPASGTVAAKIIHADLDGEEFRKEWRRVPILFRAAVAVLAPLVGLGHRWFTSRDTIASRLTMDDYRSREETMSWSPEQAAFKYSILGARDARLVQRLGETLDSAPPSGLNLAIVYGAAHMRCVLAELSRRGLRSSESAWETVFALD